MKANLTITFLKINKVEVNDDLINTIPALFNSTQKTIFILSQQILRYFKENNIDVDVKFKLEKHGK